MEPEQQPLPPGQDPPGRKRLPGDGRVAMPDGRRLYPCQVVEEYQARRAAGQSVPVAWEDGYPTGYGGPGQPAHHHPGGLP